VSAESLSLLTDEKSCWKNVDNCISLAFDISLMQFLRDLDKKKMFQQCDNAYMAKQG
jgi:hypothetical protein